MKFKEVKMKSVLISIRPKMANIKEIESAIETAKDFKALTNNKEEWDLIIEALQEKLEREKDCEYCNGKEIEYQHTHTTKLFIKYIKWDKNDYYRMPSLHAFRRLQYKKYSCNVSVFN